MLNRIAVLIAMGAIASTAAEAQDTQALPSAPEAESAVDAPATYDQVVKVDPPAPATDEAPPPKASSSRLIEEIVVTAQKREENLLDVPISINAFSSETLDARGVVDLKDLNRTTPGLNITSTAGYTVTFLRGVGNDAFILADPSVALYVDNVYYPVAQGQAQNLGLVERVEVLKGPQGTLFGRNAVGGAINVVLKDPDLQEPKISLQSSYGSFNTSNSRLYGSLPVTESLAVSLSGTYDNAGSYLDGTIGTPSRELPNEKSHGGRVAVRWAPLDVLDMNFSALRTKAKGVSSLLVLNADPAPLFQPVIQPQTGYDGSVNENTLSKVDNTVYAGRIKLDTDWFDVKLLASDQDVETAVEVDFDGSPTPLAFFDADRLYGKIQTGEVQILSNASTWGSDRFKWIAGAYYFKSRQGFDPVALNLGSTDLEQGLVLGVPIPDALAGPVADALAGLPVPGGTTVGLVALVDAKSMAYYAQGTLDLTDWASITAGARYQDEKRILVESSSGIRNGDGSRILIQSYGDDAPNAPIGGAAPGGNSRTTKSLKPKVSLDFRPADDTLVYLSWQRAIKGAAINAVNIYDPPDWVRPEKLEAYELGIKGRLFDGLMSYSAAVFQYNIDDQQVQFVSLLKGGAVAFENAGGARIRGLDFDTTVQLLPSLTDGLVLTLGGCFLDSEYTDFSNASGFDPTTRILRNDLDFTGNQISRTPKFSGSVGLSQTLQAPGGSVELGTDYYYNSGFYYLAENVDFAKENAYGLLGLHASYRYEPWHFRITVYGRNVTDTDYNYSRLAIDFGTLDAKAPPANYGVRVNLDF